MMRELIAVCGVTNVEVLGNLLLVEEAVITTTHSFFVALSRGSPMNHLAD
jgi:hypothetical protein